MIQCPSCRKDLPDWAQTCQFCGTDTKKVSRPAPVGKSGSKTRSGHIESWVWSCYYAVAAYFIISGAGGIFESIRLTHEKFMGQEMGVNFGTYLGIAFGAVGVIIGLGLILRVEIIRGITNFFCGLNIIFGLFSLAGAVFGTLFAGALGLILILKVVIDIATNGFMIFLIGETDRAM